MPVKSLEELKSAVEGLETKEDILSFYVESVEAEKNRGIQEKRRANDEAKGLRAYKKAIEALGHDGSTELEDFLEGLKDKISGKKESGSATEQELKKLRKDFEKAQKDLTEERERTTKVKQESDRKTLTAKITDSIRDKVYGADIVAENLIANGRVALEDDGTVSWIDGEDRKSFDDGIKSYVDSRQDIVRNAQKGGAGSPPVPGVSTKKFTQDQIKSMSREEVRANLADIKQSLGLKTTK
jgi:hypothetical protein